MTVLDCSLNDEFCFCPSAPRVRTLGVARELAVLVRIQPQYLLKLPSNLHKRLPGGGRLSATGRLCPHTDPEEGLANVDNDTHNLLVVFGFEGLTDGGKHYV